MKFQKIKYGRAFIGKFDHNSEAVSELKKFLDNKKISSGIFTIIGAVKNAKIVFYDQNKTEYLEKNFKEPLEIVSCSGNIAKKDNQTIIHAHIALSRKDGSMIGGHLIEMGIFAGEFYIREFKNKINRKYDEITGLNLFDF